MRRILSLTLLNSIVSISALCGATGHAQSGFTSEWENRVRKTTSQQPAWAVPVITPYAGIVQLVRTDVLRQYTPTRTLTMNYGNGKGFNLIPFYKTEVDIDLPPYVQHNTPKTLDGAGDFSAVLKYRLFAGNELHGNYALSAQVLATGATGSYKNGTASTTFTATIVGGKGFKRFDFQSSIGGTMPTHAFHSIGRTISWNNVVQYRVKKIFWPELETNSTFYFLGPHDGKSQVFLTPGLMISKIKLRAEETSRLALAFGGGMQIATSSYHAYNHALVFTARIAF
jgi:hypothetical protein